MNARLGSGMFESGVISSIFELAGPLGALSAGLLSDRLFGTRRVPVCVMGLLLLGGALFAFHHLPANRWALGGGFFVIGFLLFGPDSLIAGTAAVDFGTKRGGSTAAGVVNGCGSVGAIVGGSMPGFFNQQWGWGGVFALLGGMSVLAALLLLPRWNALPPTAARPPTPSGPGAPGEPGPATA
jgi:OPA family sugar phosphate sensor protein UhpC-like MFS transporter